MAAQLAAQTGTESSRIVRDPPQTVTATFDEAADSYETHGGDTRFVSVLRQRLGCLPLSEITQDLIDRTANVAFPNVKDSTRIRQFYVPIAAIIHHAAGLHLCPSLTIRRPKALTAAHLRWISPAESIGLVAMCSPHFRPLYLFMQHTGARPGEALFLDWAQIDLQRCEVLFPSTSEADERTLPLGTIVIAALEALPHRTGRVFRRPDGKPYKCRGRRAASAVKTAFCAACRRAAVTDFTLRDVRTTWGMWVLASTRDVNALMRLGGWSDDRMLAPFKNISKIDLDIIETAIRNEGWESHLEPLGYDDD